MKNKISQTFIYTFLTLWTGLGFLFMYNHELSALYLPFYYGVALALAAIPLFNFMIRKRLSFENYFRSPMNVWTLVFTKIYDIELPKDLLYAKLDEVLRTNGFSLVNKDDQKHKLLAITKFNFWSWGENLYVKINEHNNKTSIEFCSASVFSITCGRNKRNFEKLVEGLDNALIV